MGEEFDFKAFKRTFFAEIFPFFRFLLIERETVTSNTSPTRLRRFGSNPVQKRQPLNLAGITLFFEPGRRVHRGSIVPGHHVARLPAPLYGDIRSCDVGQQVANDQSTLVLDPFKAPLFQPRRVNGFAFAGNGTCRVVQPVGAGTPLTGCSRTIGTRFGGFAARSSSLRSGYPGV